MNPNRLSGGLAACFALAMLGACGGDPAAPAEGALLGEGAPAVAESQLTPEYWIERLEEPERVLLEPAGIAAQNRRLFELDPSMHDLEALPAVLAQERVAGWIEALAAPPSGTLYGVDGEPLPQQSLEGLVDNRNLEAMAESRPARYGLVVRRADLRTFPTRLRVYRSAGSTDIDRFQETAVFPGTPVLIAHESTDSRWWFVVSPRYAAWIEKEYVAEGDPDDVFSYLGPQQYRVITGATASTVYNPEEPGLSELQLEMGVRVPLLADWPAAQTVHGQHPYSSHVIELPVRGADGKLRFSPALLQKNADSSPEYLPLTRANIIRQGFKFLGERYGWGHSYNARDCSGFVSEVYRSMGAQMPRNTSAQSVSPVLDKRLFDESDGEEARLDAVRALDVGDLVYIPGHVMMVIGRVNGQPWVIHDTTGFGYIGPDGKLERVSLHAVSVTPLVPLMASENERYIDRMTSIVRIASNPASRASASL